jgi:Rrf2 family nitric oxide-sensitive transcriptional repressor
MKLINRNVDYAARALIFMARANKPTVSVTQMQEAVNVARPFLRKILQKLHRTGILQAVKGKGGGFALARTPENIRLSDLVAALQGPLKISECVFGKKVCQDHASCLLRRRIEAIEARMLLDIEGITIQDLV